MNVNSDIYKKIFITILLLTILLSSCTADIDKNLPDGNSSISTTNNVSSLLTNEDLQANTTIPTYIDLPADTSSNTAPYTYDAQKQPYAQSLSSADDIKRVGIRMGDVIVEGQEQLLAFSATDENNNYKVIDSNYARDEVTLLNTSPVIKYTPDYELIINLGNVYTYENGQPFTPYAFYSYDPELGSRGGYREVTEPLQAQGAYLMEIIVGVWSPRLAASEPDRAPQLSPKQPNTVYPESYTYYFTVIVE